MGKENKNGCNYGEGKERELGVSLVVVATASVSCAHGCCLKTFLRSKFLLLTQDSRAVGGKEEFKTDTSVLHSEKMRKLRIKSLIFGYVQNDHPGRDARQGAPLH